MSDAIRQITFFSFRQTAHWCTCIVRATQSNCCGSVDIFSLKPCPPNSPSWMHWLQDLGSHTAAWVWVVSQKDWRNQGNDWLDSWQCTDTAFEWKNAIFMFPRFARYSAEAHIIWGGIVKCFFYLIHRMPPQTMLAWVRTGFRRIMPTITTDKL